MAGQIATVFGGSGFLGRNLVQRLAHAGYIVRVAVRDPERAAFLKTLGDPGQIVPWPADVTEPRLIAHAVAGAGAVVNLVGILFERGRRTFQRVHVDGAANVAQAAQAAGAERLVHASAIGADTASPAAYARTKALGEEAVTARFPGATVVRPSVVFGPDDGFFNLFAGVARFTPVLPVYGCPTVPRLVRKEGGGFAIDAFGDGGTKFQPVYAVDVAKAIVAILGDRGTMGKTYELGGPKVYSFKEIMELLLVEIGRKRILVPVPFFAAAIQAWFLEFMPKPLLTRDQVKLLQRDNVVAKGALGFKDLGVEPTPAEAILPTYLHRFRRGGPRRWAAA